MTYRIERRVYDAAPNIEDSDVMTLSTAARLLKVPFSSIQSYLSTGTLTTVIKDNARRMAYGRPRRFVLRSEVAGLLEARQLEEVEQTSG